MSQAYSKQQVRKSLFHFLSGKLTSALLGILMLMLLVRLLSRQEFGGYIALLAIFELLQLGSNLGCFAATFRYIPELRTHNHILALRYFIKQLLVFRIITLVISIFILIILAPYIADFLGMPWLQVALYWYSAVILFEGCARYTDILFDSLLMQGSAQISIILRGLLRVVVLLWFIIIPSVSYEFNLIFWICVEAVASFLGVMVSLVLISSSMKNSITTSQSENVTIDYIRIKKYVIPAYWTQIIGLAQGIDVVKLLVAKFADVIQAGAFGFAAALNSMMQRYLPVFLLIGMVRPLFVSSREKGYSNEKLVGLASLIFKLNLFTLCPIYALMIIMGEPIAAILSGGKFPEASLYLVMLLSLLLFQTIRTILNLLALAVEESIAGLYGTMWGMLGIVVGVISTQYIGVVGLCIGLIVSEILACITLQNTLIHYQVGFKFDYVSILKMLIASIIAGMVLYFIKHSLTLSLLTLIIISIISVVSIFLLVCYVLKPFQTHERALINSALRYPLFIW